MAKHLGKFELPNQLKKLENRTTENTCVYVAEPFEGGYGSTIGNTYRRVLLSSIEGAAIASIKIDGAQHEFQSIDGIVEDVTDIVQNLKKVLLKSENREPFILTIDVDREGPVTAADIQLDPRVQVVNKDQVICTLDRKKRFYAEIEIKVGRGYCPADLNKLADQVIGVIPIDCLFSPVVLVTYSIENTRVGQMTDFDKLILEIRTDGRITPDEALSQATAIIRHHLFVFDQVSGEKVEFAKANGEVNEENNRWNKLMNMSVNELEMSVRAHNCLNNAGIETLGALVIKSESEMLKFRNFGKKSLNEIKARLDQLGLSLGMKREELQS